MVDIVSVSMVVCFPKHNSLKELENRAKPCSFGKGDC
jgi:hypothetical protein